MAFINDDFSDGLISPYWTVRNNTPPSKVVEEVGGMLVVSAQASAATTIASGSTFLAPCATQSILRGTEVAFGVSSSPVVGGVVSAILLSDDLLTEVRVGVGCFSTGRAFGVLSAKIDGVILGTFVSAVGVEWPDGDFVMRIALAGAEDESAVVAFTMEKDGVALLSSVYGLGAASASMNCGVCVFTEGSAPAVSASFDYATATPQQALAVSRGLDVIRAANRGLSTARGFALPSDSWDRDGHLRVSRGNQIGIFSVGDGVETSMLDNVSLGLPIQGAK